MFPSVNCQENPRAPTQSMYQKMVSVFEIIKCNNDRFFEKILYVKNKE